MSQVFYLLNKFLRIDTDKVSDVSLNKGLWIFLCNTSPFTTVMGVGSKQRNPDRELSGFR